MGTCTGGATGSTPRWGTSPWRRAEGGAAAAAAAAGSATPAGPPSSGRPGSSPLCPRRSRSGCSNSAAGAPRGSWAGTSARPRRRATRRRWSASRSSAAGWGTGWRESPRPWTPGRSCWVEEWPRPARCCAGRPSAPWRTVSPQPTTGRDPASNWPNSAHAPASSAPPIWPGAAETRAKEDAMADPTATPAPAGARGFGIDIGGSGVKGAPVDLDTGALAGERVRLETPRPSTPDAVVKVVADIVDSFGWEGPVGVTPPAVVTPGVTRTAANIDRSWIDAEAEALLRETIGRDVTLVNDTDAAGYAEARFGAARDHPGIVLVTTLGTGIGTALVVGGRLIPNTELGHLEIDGEDAEHRASDAARDRDDLSWEKWAKRLQRYYRTLENLFWPDLFVVGGGVSKKADKFLPLLDLRTPIVPAALRNEAGIVGAAMLASGDPRVRPDSGFQAARRVG